jgi:hypothetical protein
MAALPCAQCGRELTNREKENKENDPWYAVVFNNIGNLGSMSFSTEEFIELNICDDCLVKLVEKNLATVTTEDEMVDEADSLKSANRRRSGFKLIKGIDDDD